MDLIDWDPSLRQSVGIMARVSDIGAGTSNGYFFQFNPGSQNGRHYDDITIDLLQDEVATAGEMFRIDSALNTEASYRMVFQGVGDSLTGSISTLTDLYVPIASVTFNPDISPKEG